MVAPRSGRIRGFARAAVLGTLVVMAAFSLLSSSLHVVDARLPMLAVAALATAPGWVILALAAHGRGVSWAWIAFGIAWGLAPAAWLARFGESWLVELAAGSGSWDPGMGGTVAGAGFAPIVEESAKLLGILLVLSAARRAGAHPSAALGAAIGGLVGLWFGVGEVAHHLVAIVTELGYVDLDGTFVIDWHVVRRAAEAELTHKFFLAGLTNHALFSALAGVAAVRFAQRRRRVAGLWFLVALAGHALYNTLGTGVTYWLHGILIGGTGPWPPGIVPPIVAVWVTAAVAFAVAEGWAAMLLIRSLRRDLPAKPGTPGPGRRHRGSIVFNSGADQVLSPADVVGTGLPWVD